MRKLFLLLALICSPAFAQVDIIQQVSDDQGMTQLNDNLQSVDARLRTATTAINAIYPIDLSLYGTTVTGFLPITGGGTGAGTAQTAINALTEVAAGDSGKFLTNNGTNVDWGAISSAIYGTIYDYGTSSSSYTSRTSGVKIAYGVTSAEAPTSITITNLPFSSSSSYTVTVATTVVLPVYVTRASGSQFSIGPEAGTIGTYTVYWIAIGT